MYILLYIVYILENLLLSFITIVAFIKGPKKLFFVLQGILCVLFTFLGALLALISFVILFFVEPYECGIEIFITSITVAFFPMLVLNNWYRKVAVDVFGFKMHKTNIGTNVLNSGIGLIDLFNTAIFIMILKETIGMLLNHSCKIFS